MCAQDRATGPGTIKRRSFIDIVLGVGFVSTALSFLYPLFRYAIPPIAAEPATDSIIAGKIVGVQDQLRRVLKFGSKPAILVRTADGEFRAFTAVCTHLDCTVQFKADTSQIWCACHNGIYDLSATWSPGRRRGRSRRSR